MLLFEHLIYSTSIAIIAGMIQLKRTGRDYSWIIIASAMAPDFDMFTGYIFNKFDTSIVLNGTPLKHGDFHNIGVLFLFALIVGLLLKTQGMKFIDSFIFAGIGFGAHLLEDGMVYDPSYSFLWPLSTNIFGFGIINYKPDWYRLANAEVLLAGIIVMILCATVRILYEGKTGLKRIIKAFAVAGVLLIVTIPVFWFYQVDENLKDEIGFGQLVDGWKFTQNASWDTIVSYNGSHSAKIEVLGNESMISGEWRSIKIPVKPGTNYTFSSWGKIEGSGGINSPAVRAIQLDAKGTSIRMTNLIFSEGASPNLSNNWMQKQTVFRTANNTSWIYVGANIWRGYGTFWFDDVELREEGTGQNIITNSGFEMGVSNIIEITSLNKYVPVILIFGSVISLLLLRRHIPGKKI